MSETNLKQQMLGGLAWKLFERGGMQLVGFAVQVLLTRLLAPDDFGVLALVTAFISIAKSMVRNGLGNALVQKAKSDKLDECTVFYAQFLVAALLTAALFAFAPSIAGFYSRPELSECIRFMSFVLVVDAVCAIQQSILTRDMLFKKSFFANMWGTVVQGIVGVGCASAGLGYWSLILSQMAMSVAACVALVAMVQWRPSLMFSWKRFKELFGYAWKLSVGWFIGTVHQEVYSMVVGKTFSTVDLGYYNRAQGLPGTVSNAINQVVSSVLFSGLSKRQDDREAMKSMTRRSVSLSCFVIFPVMLGLAAVSKSFISVFYTEKWLPAVPMMQLFCLQFAFSSIATINIQSFNALGKSEVFMKLEIVRRGISLLLLFLLLGIGLHSVVLGLTVLSGLFLIANVFPNEKILGYRPLEFAKDTLPSLALSSAMFFVVCLVGDLPLGEGARLAAQVAAGIFFYIVSSKLLGFEELRWLLENIRPLLRRPGGTAPKENPNG